MRKLSVIIVYVIAFLAIAGASVSCASSENKENNKTTAQTELDALMFQIENGAINVDTLNDKEYRELAYQFAALINGIGTIKSSREHYFRTYFSRAPKTLDEMVMVVLDRENDIFEWELIHWENMSFHVFRKDGEYNLKFVSADGYFEAVYDKDGMLLTQDTDPMNMGTFNYANQLRDRMAHYYLDIWPYFKWNNTPGAKEMAWDVENSQPIEKNENAMKRYKEYEALLKR
jgi:hypothetical protein